MSRSLSEALGPSAAEAVLFRLEKDHGIRTEGIPREPTAFTAALKSIFGAGAEFILAAVETTLVVSMPRTDAREAFLNSLREGRKPQIPRKGSGEAAGGVPPAQPVRMCRPLRRP